jgi:hypothetical protein
MQKRDCSYYLIYPVYFYDVLHYCVVKIHACRDAQSWWGGSLACTAHSLVKHVMPSPASDMPKDTAGCIMCWVTLSSLILNTFALKMYHRKSFWSFSAQVRYRNQDLRDWPLCFCLSVSSQYAATMSGKFLCLLHKNYRNGIALSSFWMSLLSYISANSVLKCLSQSLMFLLFLFSRATHW